MAIEIHIVSNDKALAYDYIVTPTSIHKFVGSFLENDWIIFKSQINLSNMKILPFITDYHMTLLHHDQIVALENELKKLKNKDRLNPKILNLLIKAVQEAKKNKNHYLRFEYE